MGFLPLLSKKSQLIPTRSLPCPRLLPVLSDLFFFVPFRDKKLFYFDGGHRFQKIDRAPSAQLARKEDDVLERRLRNYRESHFNKDIRHACDVILREIELNKLVNYSPDHNFVEARALQLTLMRKMGGDQRAVTQLLEEIMQLIKQDGIY